MKVLVRCCIRCVKCSFTLVPVTLFLLFITALSNSPRSEGMYETWEQYTGSLEEKMEQRREAVRKLHTKNGDVKKNTKIIVPSIDTIGHFNSSSQNATHLITSKLEADSDAHANKPPLPKIDVRLLLKPNRRGVIKPSPDPLDKQLEKYSRCDNSSFIKLNAGNSNVINLCRTFLRKRAEFYSRREFQVNPYVHNFTIPGENICNNDSDIIMLIHSLHNYADRRNAIRKTWGGAVQSNQWPGKSLRTKVKIAFIFGTHKDPKQNENIRKEAEEYGDVIQGTFRENYNNMTLKSLLGLKYVKTYCKSAKYLLKSDDDMFINFPYLYAILDKLAMRRAIMGPLCVGSQVVRRGKWGLDTDVFPFHYFPPYEAGSAYVITADVITELYDTSEYVPHIFIDDVYVTGILGKILNVTHIKHDGFAFAISKKPNVDDIIANKIVTGTRVTPPYQLQLWSDLVKRLS